MKIRAHANPALKFICIFLANIVHLSKIYLIEHSILSNFVPQARLRVFIGSLDRV